MPNEAAAATLDYRDPEWVAERLGLDKNTVYKYLQDGTLPGLQLGRKWLISERRLVEFLAGAERRQTSERRAAATSWLKSLRGFGRFTARAREIIEAAADEARALGRADVGTEHLLLAITARPDSVAARALAGAGADLSALRDRAASMLPRGDAPADAVRRFTPRARKVVALADAESRALRHHYVGSEHLLLAMLAAREGIGFAALADAGLTHEAARAAVKRVLAAGD